MLNMLNKAINEIVNDTRNHLCDPSLLAVIDSYPKSVAELMKKLHLKSRNGFRKIYLQPALDTGFIRLTEPIS